MTKPSKAILYLILFFTAVNSITFLIGISIVFYYKLNFLIASGLILFLCITTALILSIIITTSAPIFKEYMATYRRLLRLDNLSHPLLLKLSQEAPGTYYHSLAVANLAYQVAKDLELNSILTRVGAYFHDIGKLNDPQFFIENQQGLNPHKQISNLKSAEIIKRHITEGIELARDSGLPNEVIDFIPEHAGTTLISYFYNLAENSGEDPKKSDYKNPGTKPKSLETAIVMIADSLEAKLRLLPEVNKKNASDTIDQVFSDKIEQNQFNILDLKEKTIEILKKSFLAVSLAQFHNRIAYPERIKKSIAKRRQKKAKK